VALSKAKSNSVLFLLKFNMLNESPKEQQSNLILAEFSQRLDKHAQSPLTGWLAVLATFSLLILDIF